MSRPKLDGETGREISSATAFLQIMIILVRRRCFRRLLGSIVSVVELFFWRSQRLALLCTNLPGCCFLRLLMAY